MFVSIIVLHYQLLLSDSYRIMHIDILFQFSAVRSPFVCRVLIRECWYGGDDDNP